MPAFPRHVPLTTPNPLPSDLTGCAGPYGRSRWSLWASSPITVCKVQVQTCSPEALLGAWQARRAERW